MKRLKTFIIWAICIALLIGVYAFSRTFSSRGNDIVCQPKKLLHPQPIFCPDRTDVDVSLGVMINGVGSMSTGDEQFFVQNTKDQYNLDEAISNGKIVKMTYDVRRFTFCKPKKIITSVTIIDTTVSPHN